MTQGDPAGIGPELLLALALRTRSRPWRTVLIAERSALEAAAAGLDPNTELAGIFETLEFCGSASEAEERDLPLAVLDPVSAPRKIVPGRPSAADARGALAALDLGIELALSGAAEALVTAPVNKATIAEHVRKDFRGHTEYLATACGLSDYGRDFLMAFIARDFHVALLNTHLPLRRALDEVCSDKIVEALQCLQRNLPGTPRIAVAGLNPHAGENGLLGDEEAAEIVPAVAKARALGIDAHGPFSPDSIFARCRAGEFDWVLAMYHDQGLIAVKTADFGGAINWTLGLPFLRTSVDHGTAYDIAGRGRAKVEPLLHTVERTVQLVTERTDPVGGW